MIFQAATDLIPIQARHDDIEQNQIKGSGIDPMQGFGTIGRKSATAGWLLLVESIFHVDRPVSRRPKVFPMV